MEYSHQAHTSHYAAPPTYYTSAAAAAAAIGPGPNPNPSSDQVPVLQGVDAYLTSPIGYSLAQYQAATQASYPIAMTAAAGGVGLASVFHGSMSTVGPVHPGKKKKVVNRTATVQDLEEKKQKLIQTGADANSVRSCTICNVVCNSDKVFASHIAGQKHIARVMGRPSKGLAKLLMNQQTTNSANTSTPNNKPKKKENKPARAVRAPTVAQSVYCEICKVTCNTQEMYSTHVSGKKHNKKIKTPTTNDNDQQNVPTGPQLEPEPKRKTKSASNEDLETKKRKLLEGGAKGDSVKVCNLCNVVCNSPTVFEYHCKGHKHRSMVKKQEQNLVGSAVVHAAVATTTS